LVPTSILFEDACNIIFWSPKPVAHGLASGVLPKRIPLKEDRLLSTTIDDLGDLRWPARGQTNMGLRMSTRETRKALSTVASAEGMLSPSSRSMAAD